MSNEKPGMNAGDEAAIERAIVRLAAAEAAAAPGPSDALVARVLADAAASRPATVALPHSGAMRAGRAAALRPRARARWSMGGMGAAAALAAGLVFGFVAGFAGPEPEMVSVAMAAEDEVIVVSDAGLALFDVEQPF